MYWYIWWGVSAFIFAFALVDSFVLTKLRYKRKRLLTSNKLLIFGTFLSAATLLFPICLSEFSELIWWVRWGKSFLVTVQQAICLFAFGGEYMSFFESQVVQSLPHVQQMLYIGTSMALYAFAPLLTLGFLLSFFQNVEAYRRYLCSFYMHTHVFTELNKKSLALAKSIDETYNKIGEGKKRRYRFVRKALIVFTDVMHPKDEKNQELVEEAKELGAILFSKDPESIRYRFRHSPRRLSFYLISENESEKIRHGESIMEDYDFDDKVELRVFSDNIRSALLLAAKDVEHMKVIRVNDIQSLVYHTLDTHGMRLFEHARADESGEKVISAVVVGLGGYGTEMVKALSWFCQMEGYRVRIHVFDRDEKAKDRFSELCPDLMNDDYNGKDILGEARYEINIRGGVDTNSTLFSKELSKITDATYIFVCLGTDEDNLAASVKIRSLCERMQFTGDGHKPDIETVIYDSHLSASMGMTWQGDRCKQPFAGVSTFNGQAYNIHMIGALEQMYSVETMIHSELVRQAEEANESYAEKVYQNDLDKIAGLPEEQYSKALLACQQKKKANNRAFYKYEYNYRSSIARVIHEKKSGELSLKSPELEHKRWNAYMRSEGYRFSGSEDESSKNVLAKLHHNLVPCANLNEKRDVPKDQ